MYYILAFIGIVRFITIFRKMLSDEMTDWESLAGIFWITIGGTCAVMIFE